VGAVLFARGRRTVFVAFALATVVALIAGVQSASSAGGGGDSYIVQLTGEPVVSYTGGTAGIPATAPAKGQKVNPNSAAVKAYVDFLKGQHAEVAGKVGASKFYDYVYAVNGFAAALTPAQAAALEKLDGVLSVEKDRLAKVETDNTPTFLGLNAPGGLWSQTAGGSAVKGENVIVGMLDTGIWPEHPSFSDQQDLAFRPGSSGKRTLAYTDPPASWHGTCQAGEQWSQDFCGNKLIGARYFLSGFGHFGVIKNDYKSARDGDGHGTHTSSTAAGNANVPASILGSSLGNVSGMAPRARVAMYKVCWNGEAGGCANTDSVAAVDAAIADGVDVINFSISGTTTNYLDAVEVAFLRASRAGVFVAASAGNSGPGVSTVAHISPWLTTVAASTQNRNFLGSVTLGNGATYTGVTLTGGVGSAPLVDAAALGDQLCHVGRLAAATGKIVLCRRGDNARVEKSLAVKQAGGVGMVLYNVSDTQSLNTDNHYIPSVHINNTNGLAVKAYAATAGATASIGAGHAVFGGGNTMADFSSRGPSLAGGGDVLKPDITAPGVNILAGNTPTAFLGAPGQLFQSISGTSMSSPHMAGMAALLVQKFPTWSPAAIKSAFMTSARQNLTKEDASTPADPFDFGAGHAVPNSAGDPGLVYDVTFDQYRGFLRGQGLCTLCFGTSPATTISAPNLNLPSFAVGKLAGVLEVTRTLTNVGPAGTYTVSVNAPSGISVNVNPSSLTFGAGESKTYTVRFTTQAGATFNAYTFGSLTWSDGSHSVRSPIAIRPVPLAAPTEITGTGTSGSKAYDVKFGYTGPFHTAVQGLQPAHTETRTLTDDPTNDFNTDDPASNQGIQVHTFTIPVGTPVARFQTFGTVNSNDDLDMYVYRVDGADQILVGQSAGGTAAEVVTLNNPAAAQYKVYIHGWQVVSGVSYTLYDWILSSADAGNLTVTAPATATTGATASVTANWSGLTAGTKYLGRISYSNGTDEIGGTIVRIDS
jgi:Subtilase family/Fibronectin type-III domain/PA domain/Peptidase inhibitor I9